MCYEECKGFLLFNVVVVKIDVGVVDKEIYYD